MYPKQLILFVSYERAVHMPRVWEPEVVEELRVEVFLDSKPCSVIFKWEPLGCHTFQVCGDHTESFVITGRVTMKMSLHLSES